MFIANALIRPLKVSEEFWEKSYVLDREGLEDTDKHKVVFCSISRVQTVRESRWGLLVFAVRFGAVVESQRVTCAT